MAKEPIKEELTPKERVDLVVIDTLAKHMKVGGKSQIHDANPLSAYGLDDFTVKTMIKDIELSCSEIGLIKLNPKAISSLSTVSELAQAARKAAQIAP